MKKSIIGKKLGTTQVFDENGQRIPLTLVEAGPCVVVRKRTVETDGYGAIQVGFASVGKKRLSKPVLGQFGDAGPFRYLREIRVDDPEAYEVGQEIKVDVFEKGDRVDIVGTSKGKGFAGTIKRYHFNRGPMSHGSKNKRAPGSVGHSAYPSRVFKGKRMPGQLGNKRVTTQRQLVYGVDVEKNLLLIAGQVPGGKGGLVAVNETVKKKRPKAE